VMGSINLISSSPLTLACQWDDKVFKPADDFHSVVRDAWALDVTRKNAGRWHYASNRGGLHAPMHRRGYAARHVQIGGSGLDEVALPRSTTKAPRRGRIPRSSETSWASKSSGMTRF